MNQILDNFESRIYTMVSEQLRAKHLIDGRDMSMPDIEEKWKDLCSAYLPDGMREFAGYPTVSLGWMMYLGMAVANLWDSDWENACQLDNIYLNLRDKRGYDCMDEYISEEVLCLNETLNSSTARLVGDMAQAVNNALRHEQIEPGTPMAFHAYVRCLHCLYMAGAQVELYRKGYRMQRMG